MAKVAEALGTPLMPWQQLVADVGLEVDANGIPFYREVWITVPRQNGKTTLILAWEIDRTINWGKPQRVLYSAQNGQEAARKLITEQLPMVERSALKPLLKAYRGNGDQAFTFPKLGSRIDILRDSQESGHGKSLDLVVIDEAFADTDDRREQAAIPALATRRDAQILGLSTAGTETSVLLRRKVDLGRKAVEENWDSGVAYFEWSAPDEAPIDDPETWRSCMPALGFTVTEPVVRHAFHTMSEPEFRRAFLNQWTTTDDRVIDLGDWERACSLAFAPTGRLVASLDVAPDRGSASVAVADSTGTVELVEQRGGVTWAIEFVTDLVRKHNIATVGIDPHGPAGSLVVELERRGINVRSITPREMATACGQLYDACVEGTARIRKDPRLDEAIAGAKKKVSGDVWYWARHSPMTDITPLVAITVARWLGLNDQGSNFSFWIANGPLPS